MSLTDYSDLEKDIDESQAPTYLPNGTEAELRIIAIRDGYSDKNSGAHWYQPVFDVPAEPLCIEFNDFLWDLKDRNKLEPKQAERSLNSFKQFAQCFGLDYSKPFEWESLIGATGWAILGVQKDAQYGDKNTVKKYIVRSVQPEGGASVPPSLFTRRM